MIRQTMHACRRRTKFFFVMHIRRNKHVDRLAADADARLHYAREKKKKKNIPAPLQPNEVATSMRPEALSNSFSFSSYDYFFYHCLHGPRAIVDGLARYSSPPRRSREKRAYICVQPLYFSFTWRLSHAIRKLLVSFAREEPFFLFLSENLPLILLPVCCTCRHVNHGIPLRKTKKDGKAIR